MIRLFQRLLLFSGLQKKRLIRSFLAYLVSSFFEMIPIMAILTVLTGILKQLSGDVMPESTIWISLGIMIVSIVGRIVFVNLSANARTLGSFAFGSEKRMEIGERLKKAPMGYFNENRLGDITAAVTTLSLIHIYMPKDEAMRYIEELAKFFNSGWKGLLRLE